MIKREANNASFSELETDLINTLKKGNSWKIDLKY
jgi:hypothetical protein